MPSNPKTKTPKTRKAPLDKSLPVAREYTIHLHQPVQAVTHKARAPRAVKHIRKFAQKAMYTSDVRIDSSVNNYLYKQGVRHVPNRIRVRLSRRRNETDETGKKLYTLVSLVDVPDFHGLVTSVVNDNE